MAAAVCTVFFLAGAAALLFETLWFHQLGLVLGNSVWTSSLVLAGFMGGLALGNGLAAKLGSRVRRRVRLYAGLELAIGITGAALVWGLPSLAPALAPLLRPLSDLPWLLNGLRLGVAFLLLLLPSTAMGATLPLLVAALCARDPHFGRVLGRLYGWNTLGAVLGAVIGHAVLLEWLGVRGSAGFALLCNALAASGALAIGRFFDLDLATPSARGHPPARRLSARALALLAAAALCGGILLALEVVWFRFLGLFVLGGSLAFAVMLGIVLTGIGLGGLLGGRVLVARPGAFRALAPLALTSGAAVVATYALFDLALEGRREQVLFTWSEVLNVGVPLMLPVSLLSGVLFTWLGDALHRESGGQTRSAGLLAMANTAGATLGALAGGFVLLPALGIERSIQLLAGAYAVTALLVATGGLVPRRRLFAAGLIAAGIALVLAAATLPRGLMRERYLAVPLDRFHAQEGTLPVVIRESLTETILFLVKPLYGEPRYFRLVTNSHSMSGTHIFARRYMKLYVYWPVAVHPDPRDALLISYGVGLTAKALTDTRTLERIDVVDTSRDILDLDYVVYPEPDDRPLSDPRVRVHIEDGRHFLQTTDRRFDLITGEPPPPKAVGIVSLFTREYFELIRERLNEGGIVTYWLPVHSFFEREAKAVIRAFCEVFEDCTLWAGHDLDWMLVGTRNARGPVSEEHFTRQWRDPVVGPTLRDLGLELPEQLGALFIAGSEELREITRDTPVLDDDHPKRIGTEPTRPEQLRGGYRTWLRPLVTRERFARSALVERLWPASMRRASLPWFAIRGLADGTALPAASAAAALRRIHPLLTETPLVTLVGWQLEVSADTRRAADRARGRGRRWPALDYEQGIQALARRDFDIAATHLHDAESRGFGDRGAVVYQIYALCMAGREGRARAVAERTGVSDGREVGDAEVWEFLTETFPQLGTTTRSAAE